MSPEGRAAAGAGRVEAVRVARVEPIDLPGRGPARSGIAKRPVAGRVVVRSLGLGGDEQ